MRSDPIKELSKHLLLIACFALFCLVCISAEAEAADPISTEDSLLIALPEEVAEAALPAEGTPSPFIYRRLLLFAEEGDLGDNFGAINVTYYAIANEFIMDFATEEDAEEAFLKLRQVFGADRVMPDLPVQIESEPYSVTDALSNSWGIDMMQLDAARDKAESDDSIKGEVTVAVLDSGINKDHELFETRLAKDPASFIEGSAYSEDKSGHGTHVAGIIADGSSNHVSILPVKVLNDEGRGGFAEVINGIYYAADQGADVINMSLAVNLNDYGNYWSDTALLQEENALKTAESKGCVCIAAAGNDSMNLDELKVYPAISEHTITISSITERKTRAASSNYGMSVDFTAPGDSIVSAGAAGSSSYCTKSGTSMAAPHVSAACAMLKLYNENLAVGDYRGALESLSVDLGEPGKDKKFGSGLIVFPNGVVPIIKQETQDQSQEPEDEPEPIHKEDLTKASVGLKTSVPYTGKTVRPEVTVKLGGRNLQQGKDYTVAWSSNKNVGTARATVSGIGQYEGKITKTFKILPKGTSIKKVKCAKKVATVIWKKQSLKMSRAHVTGYQIQYSKKSGFKTGVKTVTVKGYSKNRLKIKKLKSKSRYHFRIRTYMKTAGGTYYSCWSAAESVKVK